MPSMDDARAWYDPRDPVHGLDHVERVLRLVECLGREMGADLEVLRAAALLHDTSGAQADGRRGSHAEDSAAFARAILEGEGWAPDRIASVLHCIKAHRFRGKERPETLEAKILYDADKLDVVGAFGVARTIGYAVQAGEPLFAEPSERFLRTGEREPGEAHSAYHEYLFKLRRVPERLHTPLARAMAKTRAALLNAFFEQLEAEARGES